MARAALVMGGSTGIGREIVIGLLQRGYDVAAASRSEAKLRELEEAVASAKAKSPSFGRLITMPADATNEDDVIRTVERTLQEYGRIDILVNNQGGSGGISAPVEDITLHQWNEILHANTTSVFLCCKHVVPIMKRNRWGRIVNISSIAGRSLSFFGSVAYAASKAGVIGFSRQVSKELAPFNITVNVVAPGVIATDRIRTYWEERKTEEERQAFLQRVPMNRLGTPQEVASAVLYLVSEDASYMTGAVMDVNGGYFMG